MKVMTLICLLSLTLLSSVTSPQEQIVSKDVIAFVKTSLPNRQRPQGIIILPSIYREKILYYSDIYEVPYIILARMASAESDWRRFATGKNKDGSIDSGIMQLNSKSINYFEWKFNEGKVIDPFNTDTSFKIAAQYIQFLYKRTDNYCLAVAAYNCGLTRVKNKTIPKKTFEYLTKVFGRPIDKYSDLM
jgi:soluble lytic murein transglycosylase-like protein